jgi:hypothetical protein
MSREYTDGLFIDLEYFTPEEYLVYVAEAQAHLGSLYIESGYIDADYYEGQEGAVFSISCELTEVVGELKEASASLTAAASLSATGNKAGTVEANLTVSAGASAANSRIRSTSVAITGAMTADITVFATMNGEILLIANASMATTSLRIRDNDVALTNIVNLSLQAARFAAFDSALTTEFSQANTSADVTRTTSSNTSAVFASSASLDGLLLANAALDVAFATTCAALNVQLGSSANTSEFTATCSPISFVRKDLSPRPVDWVTTSNTTFDSTVKKYGTAALRFNSNSLPAFIQSDNPVDYFNIAQDQDFAIEFWFRYAFEGLTANSTLFTYTPSFYISNVYNGAFQENSLTLNFFGNTVTTNRLTSNAWHHISVVRASGTVYFRVNQISAGSISDNRAVFDDNDYIEFRATTPAKTFYIDEFALRVGESTVNGYTSSPTNTQVETQLMLTHFDGNYLDDITGFTLQGSALLTSAFSQTSTAGLVADITALEAGTFALSADVERIIQGQSTLTTSATLGAITGFVQSADATLDAFVSEIVVVNKIGNTLIDIPMITTLTAQANEIVQLSSALNTEFAQTISANLNALASSSLNSAFTLPDVYAGPYIYDIDSPLNSAFSTAIDVQRIRSSTVAASSEFNQTASAVKTCSATLALSANSTIAVDYTRIKPFSASLDFIGSELAAVAKIGDFLITLDTSSSMSTSAVVKTGSVIGLNTAATTAIVSSRTRATSANLDSQFIQTVSGIINVEGSSNINVSSSLVADASKITDVQIAIQGAMSFAAVAKGNLAGEIDLDTTSTLTADAVAIRGVQADLNVLANIQAQQTTIRQTNANFNLSISITADGRIITLLEELEYVIPQETRVFKILQESREYTIEFETREHII